MDNKYLVVGDSPTRRRITIWNVNGKFINVVRTKKNNFETVALQKNWICYLSFRQYAEKKNGYNNKYLVIFKNIKSGTEKTIREITLLDRSFIDLGKGMSSSIGNFIADVFMVKTIDGNLAIGISNIPKINIYSPDGEVILSFALKITPIPVNAKYIKKFRDNFMDNLRKKSNTIMDINRKRWHDIHMKFFPTFDFSTIFDKYLPLYYELLVDTDGNFLVFRFTDCLKDCKTYIQVYSKKGEFICETELDKGNYDFEIDKRFRNICFTNEGIIGLFMNKGDEYEIIRLVKSKY